MFFFSFLLFFSLFFFPVWGAKAKSTATVGPKGAIKRRRRREGRAKEEEELSASSL
jgi:hypothetical protein